MEEKESFWGEYGFETVKIAISALLIVLSYVLPVSVYVKAIVCAAAAIVSGINLIKELPEALKEKEFFGENTLMLIACVVAFILGEWSEGALIITLFSLGELLEDIATDNSHKKIAGLAEVKSETARLVVGHAVVEVSPDTVPVGSIIEVRQGDRVPIDGELLDEICEFDLKAITGESKFHTAVKGSKVYGGAINKSSAVRIKTVAKYEDSTAERIIAMVESSGAKKAKSQKFITEFAKIYTPCVIALAVLISVIPPLFDGNDFAKWITKALNFMVISCPCALVISVPLGYFVGIGSLARRGILIKGSNYVETLSKVKTFAFDKTGTLTEGNFTVSEFSAEENMKNIALTAAFALEKSSSHPIAKAVADFCESAADKEKEAINIKEITGVGVSGEMDGKTYFVGGEKMLKKLNIPAEKKNGSYIYVITDGKIAGVFGIEDRAKKSAAETVARLKEKGIKNFCILSGDDDCAVKKVAKETGIDTAYSSLLPEDKLSVAENLIKNSGPLAYSGDGINDAPVLKLADIGIAMGGLGSDAAVECADMVIMDDDLNKIATAYSHSKKIRRTVSENIIGSIAVKLAIMAASVLFTVPVYLAMFADVGVMLLCVLNSLRNYKIKG